MILQGVPMSSTDRLLFYVSGHGFGHATRTSAVIAALRARAQREPRVHVRSQVPRWLFAERDPSVECSASPIDVGLVQPNGLDVDLPGTLAAHEALTAAWENRVADEARAIRELGASLVVGDIPPLAFAAALRAGVPAVAVGNFSWDWVLEAYTEADPRWGAIAARYREAYGEAETLFRLPLHGDLSAFREVVDVPLLVNRSTRTTEACRAALGIDRDEPRKLVLVSFGGLGAAPVDAAAPDELPGYLFVGADQRPETFRGEWIALSRPFPISHEDLMQACDAVIGKAGYSTAAEALAHRTRFLYVAREGFRETPVLERGLVEHGCARAMPRADFVAGRWRCHLDALFAQPDSFRDLATDGADVIADALLARLDRPS